MRSLSMLTNIKFKTLQKGLCILALPAAFALALNGACSSSSATPVPGMAGHGGAGTSGAAGTGGGAGTTGTAGPGPDGGGGTGAAGSGTDGGGAGTGGGTDGGLTPMQVHMMLINAPTTGGVDIGRAAPKPYDMCK